MLVVFRHTVVDPHHLTNFFRFLHECPWERLEEMRKLIPNIPFQAPCYTSFLCSSTPVSIPLFCSFLSTFTVASFIRI
jgi:hypothetical protein